MTKLTIAISSAIHQLRKCGLMLPRSVSARRLLDLRDKDDFIDEVEGGPRENLIEFVLYHLASEHFLEETSVPVGSRGFHLDFECVYGDGDYATLVRRLAFLAGQESEVCELRDWVDVPGNEVFIKFNFKRKEHYFRPKVDRDWADGDTLKAVANLFSRKGYQFYQLSDGVVLFLKNSIAKRIYMLAPRIELEAF